MNIEEEQQALQLTVYTDKSVFQGADVTKEETTRSEMEKGEREQSIIVKETAISQAIGGACGTDGKIRDRQGKSLVVQDHLHTW